jgi:hypothetical protein
MTATIRKDELEAKIKEERELVRSGELREENPLDLSPEFEEFLQACRRGDLRRCQEMISTGVNINGKDQFDYTPLIIVGYDAMDRDRTHMCSHVYAGQSVRALRVGRTSLGVGYVAPGLPLLLGKY